MPSIIGIDEAGRGPWAGPVVAGAVFFETKKKKGLSIIKSLNDSKKLSKLKREKLFEDLRALEEKNICFIGVGVVSSEIIDTIGIRPANKMAMQIALDELKGKLQSKKIDKIKIDGRDNYIFENNLIPTEYIIKGDSKVDEIKAASIIAKVTRDALMLEYDKKYPHYGFSVHQGYGTKRHFSAIYEFGVCDIHRRSYAPIKKALILEQDCIE